MIDLLPLFPYAAGEERKTRAMRKGTEGLPELWEKIAPVLQAIRLKYRTFN